MDMTVRGSDDEGRGEMKSVKMKVRCELKRYHHKLLGDSGVCVTSLHVIDLTLNLLVRWD